MSTELTVVENMLTAYTPKFAALLPASLPPERLIRTVMVSLEQNPTLANADRGSIMRSAMSAAVLGLEVDGVSGQGYLVPFKGKCQFLCGYKGLVTLAARAGRTLEGHVVYAGDHFVYDEGADRLEHRWSLDAKRERVIGAYAKSRAEGTPTLLKVLSLADILAVRDKSAGWKAKGQRSPWGTDFGPMARKTAMRALSNDIPVLALHLAASLDTQHDLGHYAAIDPEGGGVVVETGEAPEARAEPIEGEVLQELGPTDKVRVRWPDGSESDPLVPVRYAGLISRATLKANAEQAKALWRDNRETVDRLPDKQRSEVYDAFAAKEVT